MRELRLPAQTLKLHLHFVDLALALAPNLSSQAPRYCFFSNQGLRQAKVRCAKRSHTLLGRSMNPTLNASATAPITTTAPIAARHRLLLRVASKRHDGA
ncbi:hypothetical protein, partial [Xanthomonas citri]|uniref:hypothetical protein n=1 Tax=Xanthomonas citri TaxID=346 RepID=UPI001F3B591D